MSSSASVVSGMRIGLVALCWGGWAWAGGSNYGVVPGALPAVAGKVSEWAVPTPQFARDPAPGPDGNIYIAVMRGNRIARFETASQRFTEWALPRGAAPHGLVFDARGDLWFTVQNGQRVGRLERASGRIVEYPMTGNPYGLAIDQRGLVWVCRMFGDALGWIDPATGQIGAVPTGDGSRPRRVATAPDGSLWVAYYGNGKLAQLDPVAKRIVKTWDMPPGGGKDPYAVTVDARGRVWVNGIDTDTVSLFDPQQESFRVIALPSKNVGIRKAIVDAQGRYWYMGSHNGRLGMIE